MRINIGSGDRPADGWINVDSFLGVHPDVVADVCGLPFADGSAEAVYCGHVLEHLELTQVPSALAEIRRVSSGPVCIVGPDYDRAVTFEDDVLLRLIRDGGNRWKGDRHLWLSTANTTLGLIRDAFSDAVEEPIEELDSYWPTVSRVGWQFAITAER